MKKNRRIVFKPETFQNWFSLKIYLIVIMKEKFKKATVEMDELMNATVPTITTSKSFFTPRPKISCWDTLYLYTLSLNTLYFYTFLLISTTYLSLVSNSN